MRYVLLAAAVVLFVIAGGQDFAWWGTQRHEGGFIAFGLAALAASFAPWREVRS